MRLLAFVVMLCWSVLAGSAPGQAGAVSTASMAFCGLTHPVAKYREYQGQIRKACEFQHAQPQSSPICQRGSLDLCHQKTVLWGYDQHTDTDRAGERRFLKDVKGLAFTTRSDINLESAYRLGTYGLRYHVVEFDYRNKSDWRFIALNMDATANLVYAYSWTVNVPQKVLGHYAYIMEKKSPLLLIDFVISLVLLPLDFCLMVICTTVGVIYGAITQPINSITGVPGGLWFCALSTWRAVVDTAIYVPRAIWATVTVFF